MALFHSLNLWVLHFIACQLIEPQIRLNRFVVVVAVLLGALNPGFLFELGSSYADIIVSIPTMLAFLCILVWRQRGSWVWLYSAGVCAGVAVGLKPSSLVFCGALAVTLLVTLRLGEFAPAMVRLIVAGLLGVVVAGGSHAWMLWEAFGSPVFPLFNGLFLSPWFHPFSFTAERFMVTSLAEFVLFPFHMADSTRRTGLESLTVDIRPSWMLGLGAIWLVKGVVVVLRRGWADISSGVSEKERFFWIFLLVFLPLWILTSGNVRYAIPVLVLLGVAIALLAKRLGGTNNLTVMLIVLVPLVAQSALALGLNTPNFYSHDSHDWGRPWLDMKIPPPLHKKPAYYLSLQSQSFASLAPLFPKKSRFYNLIGATASGAEGPVFKKVVEDQVALGLPFRSLYDVTLLVNSDEAMQSIHESQDILLSEFGYKVDRGDCYTLENSEPLIRIISCGVRKADPLSTAERERRREVDRRFARWEQKCPQVFAASGIASIQGLNGRSRFYPGTDFQLFERQDGSLFALDLFNTCRPSILLEGRDGTAVVSDCPVRMPFSSEAGNCAG